MMSGMFVALWLALSFLNAGLFDPLDKQNVAVSNADACTELKTEGNCKKAGPCVWSGTTCSSDPCFERTLSPDASCSNTSCVRVTKFADPPVNPPVNSHFCVSPGRETLFTTQDEICSLEWGGYKYVELAACKIHSGEGYGCGPVELIEGSDTAGKTTSHYVCKAGNPPDDPCTKITDPDICTYVGECMYEGGSCVTDWCWEKTLTTSDDCKLFDFSVKCEKHVLNPDGNVQLGYCKSPNHDLHSPCNVGTATNFVTKELVCSWPGFTNIPSECSETATIDNYDGGKLYVCTAGSISLKPFGVTLSILVFLIMML